MAPQYDIGMSVDDVKAEAAHMQQKGDKARKYVTDLLAKLAEIRSSWWGARSADAQAQVEAARDSINQFHIEIKEMSRILSENAAEFVKFDQTR